MSRVTLFSLLFALLLGLGIRVWSEGQHDACAAYLSGDARAQSSEWVMSGSRQVEVSCNDWLARQPLRIQILWMVDVILAIVFLLNALSDLSEWLAMRRRMRGMV